ncbi:Acetyltransferase (GNAT) domain-containing protein [Algoriphagus ornithinivorans]|uniref:Acetyltransferase (GNAT) domain-containing protein n=1 Tax=Algoriphagus ornithinivorans TaxID=226506 RepID=A0A1I5ANZ1_9BACT|nr:GNAT family N-acetyltransferase [Algoriphagus ornithinivorans]SFN64147.1 Acetyltransferase (GNAT) domain-containing protein [Algoriphagus ornithinivorans]
MDSEHHSIVIREASLEEILSVHREIPEFQGEVSLDFYKNRLANKSYLALVAELEGELLGFKIGYEGETPKIFYSWMGGVKPEFRKMRIAESLADYQEKWALEKGFDTVYFKTRNRFSDMINFAFKRGFQIVDFFRKGDVEDFRIVMMKKLDGSKIEF